MHINNIKSDEKLYERRLKKERSEWLKWWWEKCVSSLAGHHGHELVKVDGAALILVDLVDDLVEVVLTERCVDLPEDLFEDVSGDVAVTLDQFGWI